MAAHTIRILNAGVSWAHRQIDSENYVHKLTSCQNSATSMHSFTYSKPTEGIKTFRNIAQAKSLRHHSSCLSMQKA